MAARQPGVVPVALAVNAGVVADPLPAARHVVHAGVEPVSRVHCCPHLVEAGHVADVEHQQPDGHSSEVSPYTQTFFNLFSSHISEQFSDKSLLPLRDEPLGGGHGGHDVGVGPGSQRRARLVPVARAAPRRRVERGYSEALLRDEI